MAEYIEREALLEDFRAYMAERFDKEKCVLAENCEACERKCLWHRVVMKAPAIDAYPCTFCAYDPPSSRDGKPCSFCPATAKRKDGE